MFTATVNTVHHTFAEGLPALPFQGPSLILANAQNHQEGKAYSPNAPQPDCGLQSQCHGFEHYKGHGLNSRVKNELEEIWVLEVSVFGLDTSRTGYG